MSNFGHDRSRSGWSPAVVFSLVGGAGSRWLLLIMDVHHNVKGGFNIGLLPLHVVHHIIDLLHTTAVHLGLLLLEFPISNTSVLILLEEVTGDCGYIPQEDFLVFIIYTVLATLNPVDAESGTSLYMTERYTLLADLLQLLFRPGRKRINFAFHSLSAHKR